MIIGVDEYVCMRAVKFDCTDEWYGFHSDSYFWASRVTMQALQLLDVDQFGLDDMDSRILKTIIEKFDGGPVGVGTIAAAVGEDQGTIEEVYEPFLVQNGFLQRTSRGRMATAQAYRHFGFVQPVGPQQTLF